MAQTISHEAKAPVKKNPGKEALVRLLERSYDQLADLQEDIYEIQQCIDPEPRPLPETVNPATLMSSLLLRDEAEAVKKGAEAFGRTVEEFHRAARRMRSQLASGRNARAWGKLAGWLDEEAKLRVDTVDNAIRALLWHTRIVAALVTFAKADDLPESISEEAGNE